MAKRKVQVILTIRWCIPLKLIPISQAARLLGVSPATLRRRETPDGQYVEVYGERIRVYRLGDTPGSQRRYDEREVYRVLVRMAKGKVPREGGPDGTEG